MYLKIATEVFLIVNVASGLFLRDIWIDSCCWAILSGLLVLGLLRLVQNSKFVVLYILTCYLLYIHVFGLLNNYNFIWSVIIISLENWHIIAYWIACLVMFLSIASLDWFRQENTPVSVNLRRKYCHLMCLVMFWPAIILDLEFTRLGLAVGLAALVILESFRSCKVWPAALIQDFVNPFLDSRDNGSFIVSNIFLMLGCSIPIWLPDGDYSVSFGGLLSLCVGDSMASIIGKKFGQNVMFGTRKSVEGTLAFIFSLYASTLVTRLFVPIETSLFACIAVGFVEAYSPVNDNLAVPLSYAVLMRYFFI
jgi:dolichol kinase